MSNSTAVNSSISAPSQLYDNNDEKDAMIVGCGDHQAGSSHSHHGHNRGTMPPDTPPRFFGICHTSYFVTIFAVLVAATVVAINVVQAIKYQPSASAAHNVTNTSA